MFFSPHEYQRKAIRFIEDREAAGLFLGLGLGKTVITLTAINDLIHDRFEVARALVIAPLRVAEDTWSSEAGKWDHLSELTLSKVLGSAAERKAGLERDADVYVINRENVPWLVDYLAENKKPWPFDMVVIDELSSFKSPSAKRFKALRKVRPYIDRIVGLTGTPVGNSLLDLWAEIYLLDRGERLGKTFTGYRATWFRPGYSVGGVVYKWLPIKDAEKSITQRIEDLTMSMSAEDYLDLPDLIETDVRVSLTDKALKTYQEMERDAVAEIDGKELTAFSAAAVMSKLLQMANGFAYTEAGETVRIHDAKLDALEELIEGAGGEPVLCFYEFVADKARILEKFKGARVLESDKDIAAWNRGEVPLLIAHPASAGYGLNLQQGGHILVWFGLPWSLEQYQQAIGRLHRQGQDKPVRVYHLVAAGTVDEQVARSLKAKDTTQAALLAALKERRDYEDLH